MEADWEIEIGGGAPVIETHWSGFVDLRLEPERVRTLSETDQLPALAAALVRLNEPTSAVWTSKCDVFVTDQFDPDELDAPRGCALRALACYIDFLPRDEDRWPAVEVAASACTQICDRLHGMPHRSCRADLVIRRALMAGEVASLGVTAYITAAGPDDPEAASAMAAALAAFADAAGASPLPNQGVKSYNGGCTGE
jgi:hypothetical protein